MTLHAQSLTAQFPLTKTKTWVLLCLFSIKTDPNEFQWCHINLIYIKVAKIRLVGAVITRHKPYDQKLSCQLSYKSGSLYLCFSKWFILPIVPDVGQQLSISGYIKYLVSYQQFPDTLSLLTNNIVSNCSQFCAYLIFLFFSLSLRVISRSLGNANDGLNIAVINGNTI